MTDVTANKLNFLPTHHAARHVFPVYVEGPRELKFVVWNLHNVTAITFLCAHGCPAPTPSPSLHPPPTLPQHSQIVHLDCPPPFLPRSIAVIPNDGVLIGFFSIPHIGGCGLPLWAAGLHLSVCSTEAAGTC